MSCMFPPGINTEIVDYLQEEVIVLPIQSKNKLVGVIMSQISAEHILNFCWNAENRWW